MDRKINYTVPQFYADARKLASEIDHYCHIHNKPLQAVYGIPRGGVPLALRLSTLLGIPVAASPDEFENTLVVDDVADSGKTISEFITKKYLTAVLHVKGCSKWVPHFSATRYGDNPWIIYWWETDEQGSIEDVIVRQIQYLGEDINREGLRDTPRRVVESWKELFCGYTQDPKEVFTDFDGEGYGGLVYLRKTEFHSTCEHHLLPFSGEAMIAYIPNGRLIGASKLGRILDIYARRLQMQERISEQIVNGLMEHLKPLGAACLIEGKHACISCRGVKKQNSIFGYDGMKGVFLEDSAKGAAARAEIMSLYNRP